jgi:hypothetical protein
MEEENNKIVVDFKPGTELKEETPNEEQPLPPQETKQKKTRNHKLTVRLEGEPIITKEESPPQEQIKPKRAPPKRKQQTEQEIKPVEPSKEEVKEIPKEENIKIVKMVKCDKCQKSMTPKSLKYSHKCGEEKTNIKKTVNKPIEYEQEEPLINPKQETPKGNFPPYELNPRIQRMKEKEKKICKLIENAF